MLLCTSPASPGGGGGRGGGGGGGGSGDGGGGALAPPALPVGVKSGCWPDEVVRTVLGTESNDPFFELGCYHVNFCPILLYVSLFGSKLEARKNDNDLVSRSIYLTVIIGL